MPHQSSHDAISETALLSEYWDAVLDYANLCTISPQDGMRLATEAFRRGIRETRNSRTRAWGPRLPWLPLLLSSVRKTAADWQARQAGERLDPALRIWLTSDRARRYANPRREQPLALRGLWDLPEGDAELLWSVEVESHSLTTVARRLGWDNAYTDEEIRRVRARFRELCQRNHVDTLTDEECRSYSGLLDAATRSPDAAAPEDLWEHLARCMHCKEAAACLYLHGSGLPGALAGGVLGWGGLPYLERRRRVAAEHTGGSRLGTLARSVGPPLWERVKGMRGGRGRFRMGRAGSAAAATAATARTPAGTPTGTPAGTPTSTPVGTPAPAARTAAEARHTFDAFGRVAAPRNTGYATDGFDGYDPFDAFDPFGTTSPTDPFDATGTLDAADLTGAAGTTSAYGATGVIRPRGEAGRRRAGGGGRRRRPRKGRKTRAAGILAAAAAVSVIAIIAYTNTDADQDDGLPPDGNSGPGALPTVGPTHLPSPGGPSDSHAPPSSGTSEIGHRTNPSKPTTGKPSPDDDASPDKPSKKHPSKDPETAGTTCTARYTLDNEWPDGFQAKVTLTPRKTVHNWRLSWEFESGQRVTQMWNGEFEQRGSKVTVTPAEYNETARAGEALEVGFLGSWDSGNATPTDLALNGHHCDTR
ncbi:cellulose binding domain-containing protein [Streptomyces sp. NPDC059590]|uniref:cellulose binding domain-containing protein n=1 Tax=Streptomyces sp. NPDC059590 TaxID=3346877 RepID=UPI0036931569